jgi:hypothetical protein
MKPTPARNVKQDRRRVRDMPTASLPLTDAEIAVLKHLREVGPQKLSMLHEEAVDAAFKRRPRLVFISESHPDNPKIDVTREGMLRLAEYERGLS